MTVSVVFKSVGHFLATVFQKALKAVPAIEATATTVEAVTAAIPTYGPLAVTVEKGAYAILGEVAAVLIATDAAGKSKLVDAGLDINVIETVEALVKAIPQFVQLITKL